MYKENDEANEQINHGENCRTLEYQETEIGGAAEAMFQKSLIQKCAVIQDTDFQILFASFHSFQFFSTSFSSSR